MVSSSEPLFPPAYKDGIVGVVVDKRSVQCAKAALDKEDLLDRTRKIMVQADQRCCIPIRLPEIESNEEDPIILETLRKILDLLGITYQITFKSNDAPASNPKPHHDHKQNTVLESLIKAWIEHIPVSILEATNVSHRDLLVSLPKLHARYPPLLLFSKSSFTAGSWRKILELANLEVPTLRDDLYRSIADALQITHIARLGSIPISEEKEDGTGSSCTAPNVLRRPTQLLPLFGDFGKYAPDPSSSMDLPDTVWVSTKQNGIHQCWAPLYTMFSLGNVTEKQRLLRQLEQLCGGANPAESTAVDLYAGIGYFSFCYAKAGFKKVLSWELNPWSVEGLRRGAAMNRWGVHSVSPDALSLHGEDGDYVGSENDVLIVFEEDNKHAAKIMKALRPSIPPVRHVNCGILPTSEPSWKDTIEILDPALGGWIHLHENIIEREKFARIEEILRSLRALAVPRRIKDYTLHKVKSYGPGITHYVLDVEVHPATRLEQNGTS